MIAAPQGGVADLATAIRDRIIRGELEPGQRLKEEWLASEFGVSRIPLREGLRELAAEGFVRSARYGGTFVAMLDEDAARDLLDVRAVLEPLAAAQAAIRRTDEQLERFHTLMAEAEQAAREHRYEDIRRLKAEFFEHLAVSSQNFTLIELMRVVRHKIEWATSIEAMKTVPEESRTRRARLHEEIVEAIARREPARAAAAVAANIDATYASQGWARVLDSRFERI